MVHFIFPIQEKKSKFFLIPKTTFTSVCSQIRVLSQDLESITVSYCCHGNQCLSSLFKHYNVNFFFHSIKLLQWKSMTFYHSKFHYLLINFIIIIKITNHYILTWLLGCSREKVRVKRDFFKNFPYSSDTISSVRVIVNDQLFSWSMFTFFSIFE